MATLRKLAQHLSARMGMARSVKGNYLRTNGTTTMNWRIKKHQRLRRALSLLELVVSMGLLALIMVPVISLLGTSYKVMNASSERAEGSYARQSALDAIGMNLRGCTQVLDAQAEELVVLTADGNKTRLSFSRGELLLETALGQQSLTTGLSGIRFSVGAKSGAPPAAGELILVEVASRGPSEPTETWSSTQLWIRPPT